MREQTTIRPLTELRDKLQRKAEREDIKKEIDSIVEKICILPESELIEIYFKLNSWQWDSRLGEKPKLWEHMPNYNENFIQDLMKRKTKMDYLRPLGEIIYLMAENGIKAEERAKVINFYKTKIKTEEVSK